MNKGLEVFWNWINIKIIKTTSIKKY